MSVPSVQPPIIIFLLVTFIPLQGSYSYYRLLNLVLTPLTRSTTLWRVFASSPNAINNPSGIHIRCAYGYTPTIFCLNSEIYSPYNTYVNNVYNTKGQGSGRERSLAIYTVRCWSRYHHPVGSLVGTMYACALEVGSSNPVGGSFWSLLVSTIAPMGPMCRVYGRV